MAGIVLDHVTKEFANGVVAVDDVSLEVGDGEFLVLVGPSGCGKSTLLRLIAGLEEVTSGEIVVGDRLVTDLPPKQRDTAMVFQNYAIYPHLSVAGNIGFGLKVRRTKKKEIERRVREVAAVLGITDLLDRKPDTLSGGQRQRVAMGRAIVRQPSAYLMDEPLSNLDAKLRVQMRAELARLHQRLGTTTVFVTHDQIEAMTLGQRVAVLKDGVLQQVDTPQALYRSPANVFVAAFIGSPPMNLVEAVVVDGAMSLGSFTLPLPGDLLDCSSGRRLGVGIRPSDLRPTDADGPGTIAGVVEIKEELGDEIHVMFAVDAPPLDTDETRAAMVDREDEEIFEVVQGEGAHFTARLSDDVDVSVGDRIHLHVDPERVYLFDVETGATIRSPRRPAVTIA